VAGSIAAGDGLVEGGERGVATVERGVGHPIARPAFCRIVGRLHDDAAVGRLEADREPRLARGRDLPPRRYLRVAGETDGERGPRGLGAGIDSAEGREPGGIADERPHEVGVARQLGEHRGPRAVAHPSLQQQRLHRRRTPHARERGLDGGPEPGHEPMRPLRKARDEHRAGVAADHVELIRPEHRQLQRLRQHERPARLNEHLHRLRTVLGPAGGAHEDGVADGRVEEGFPTLDPGRVEPRVERVADVVGRDEAVSPPRGGLGDLGDPSVAAEQAESEHDGYRVGRGDRPDGPWLAHAATVRTVMQNSLSATTAGASREARPIHACRSDRHR